MKAEEIYDKSETWFDLQDAPPPEKTNIRFKNKRGITAIGIIKDGLVFSDPKNVSLEFILSPIIEWQYL